MGKAMAQAGLERAAELHARLHGLTRTLALALLAFSASCAMLYLCTAHAADLNISAFTVKTNPDGTSDYSVSLQVVVLMTLLSFLPSILIMMTSFTRIVIVLAILRQAMGLQTSPSNQVIIGISLFLTLFIMTPVFDQVYTDAIEPYINDQIQAREAFEKAQVPLKHFMVEQTRLSDINAFADYAGEKADTPEGLPMRVVIPAFMVSELKTAFQIGFMIFLPFLIIDLVVASILMAMGMMMLSPMIVSLPFKLMLFVLVDGWTLITGTLVQSYGLGVPS